MTVHCCGLLKAEINMTGGHHRYLPSRSDVFVSMLPKYEKLVKANLKMLVFSGDPHWPRVICRVCT